MARRSTGPRCRPVQGTDAPVVRVVGKQRGGAERRADGRVVAAHARADGEVLRRADLDLVLGGTGMASQENCGSNTRGSVLRSVRRGVVAVGQLHSNEPTAERAPECL